MIVESRVSEALIRLVADLRAVEVQWALIGGLAVSARTEPRTTRDIDLAVSVLNDREAEWTVRSLGAFGYRIGDHFEQEATGRLSTIRLVPGEKHAVVVDLLFSSSGIEPEIVEAADLVEILPGLTVPVATIGHLLALKVLAYRPDEPDRRSQDLGDIGELLRVADQREIARARHAVDLISRRGYDRKKDLRAELERHIENASRRGRRL